MEELRDIQGLDLISMWPLAMGWWIVLSLILIGCCVLLSIWFKRKIYKRSWQYSSYCNLQQIQQQIQSGQNLKLTEHKQLLDQLAIEIRRMAMATTTRQTCAGLSGQSWLGWLQQHDPRGFAWEQHGQLLISGQYKPVLDSSIREHMLTLIAAAKEWVKKC